MAGAAVLPGIARAQVSRPAPGQGAPATTAADSQARHPAQDGAIIPDDQFEQSIPPLSDDIDAPLEPIAPLAPGVEPAARQSGAASPDADLAPVTLPSEADLAAPLPPLSGFDVTPVVIAGVDDQPAVAIRYETRVEGLEAVGLDDQFKALSALRKDNDAPNAAVVNARAKEDEGLAVRLMQSLGYYDATATSAIEQIPGQAARVRATVTAVPGQRYLLGSITVKAGPTVPPDLIAKALPLKTGDPIEAERIQGAEANVALQLPQQGYAFAEVGQRDILLDDVTLRGDYTLPVETGPRGTFGGFALRGDPVFDADHIAVLARFKPGELYDSRKVDDLRQALVATSLFSSVGVSPRKTGRPGPDGTEQVDLTIRQNKGPARTIAGTAGYGTGQGLRAEASWTHRNLFPPEGALIVAGVAGTQEQGLSTTFRRSNAGRRDRTFSLIASASHSHYDAFDAFTGTIAARISYDSTPIWQKRWTYYYGGELVGTNESVYDFARDERVRRTYGIAALPTFLGYDTSDNLLNPTRGFRLKLNVSPETSVQGSVRPYVRTMVEGTGYYPVTDSLVIAGRVRAGVIAGVARDDLAPSRRYYSGGGGSVRGFGYQGLGPRTIEPNPDYDPTNPDEKDSPTVIRPVGGRSLNEFSIEARYRFGNFGIVPFVDAGQVYDSVLPKGRDIRFGAGIGARYYTNFGPFRIDVATPINRKPGEAKIALYLSIGQAF
ncbi:BamA/TamA family outer membrane protein [Sphingomonas sp.]|uniref:BamA/TamA family outer membrane protein n=1 Tax=Sphingomonas sp. TaxID=28214 RepID=UPI002C8DB88B|nr:BamA/TamA family outer membrane protein [Sphingomonas sp.]HWK35120.1 BamA/TamA family outer membrane protein [Sphingomonas sp.]